MANESEPRIYELATGFALGELDDGELREFYDALRAPGAAGAEAARAAWETLSTVVDLRAELGTGFQDALLLRLSEEFAGGDPAFAERLRGRLGHVRARLAPIEPPPPPRRRRGWLIAALVAALAIGLGAMALALADRGEAPVATVAALAGSPTLEGRGLRVGAAIDRRQLVVPAGAQLTLAWSDGARATIAGPAAAVAGRHSLSLPSGRLWCRGADGFSLGLPDRATAIAVPAGAVVAIAISDSRSTLALASGRIADHQFALEAGQVIELSHPQQPYSWRSDRLDAGADALPGADHARWQIHGSAIWSDPSDHLRLRLHGVGGDASEVVLDLAPARAQVLIGGVEVQLVTLGGAPLGERRIELRGAERALTALIGSQRVEVALPAPTARISWEAVGGARLGEATFGTGPERAPPLAME